MVIEHLKSDKFVSDDYFDTIYSPQIKSLSSRHWTPVTVAKTAAEFLCNTSGTKVLDIGSGAGKFCLTGAALNPHCNFYGVDLRKNLVDASNKLKTRYQLKNVEFINSNIFDIGFDEYNSAYFFNSFHELVDGTSVIDEKSIVSYDLYRKYTIQLFFKFNEMPLGARIATYYTSDSCIPDSFKMVECLLYNRLKLYVKVKNDFIEPHSLKEDLDAWCFQ